MGGSSGFCDSCDAFTPLETLICKENGRAISAIVPLELEQLPAMLTAVTFYQHTQGILGFGLAHLFCRKKGAPAPYSSIDEPLLSVGFIAFPDNDDTCVSVPLPSPFVVPTSCEVLWVELETTSSLGLVALSTACGAEPATGEFTWLATTDCGLIAPVNVALGFGAIDAFLNIDSINCLCGCSS